MGEVCRRVNAHLYRQVAIKALPTDFAQETERLARFERDATALATFNHPNTAQVYGFEQSSSVHALVMKVANGPTLADLVPEGPIPVNEALTIVKQIPEALRCPSTPSTSFSWNG